MTTPDHEADTLAMERLKMGDDLALNELMERWQEPLTHFLTRYTSNEADALDLAQDTFVRIYEARTRYKTGGKFSTWLYSIALNLCRNHARYRTRHPTVTLDGETKPGSGITLGDHIASADPSPASLVEADECVAAVRNAIAILPEDQRAVTILSEYEDRSHTEIAVLLGCSTKSVESKLYRARQFLRDHLRLWLNQ